MASLYNATELTTQYTTETDALLVHTCVGERQRRRTTTDKQQQQQLQLQQDNSSKSCMYEYYLLHF